jgi:Polyketide cyclase / dehydrase and lipid transport
MASITKTIPAAAGSKVAWQKISDIGAVDKLVDMIASCSLDGDMRTCTLPDGQAIKERVITVDEAAKRVVYSVTEGPLPMEFHCASVQVTEENTQTIVVWTVDVKPDEMAAPLSEMMDGAAQSMAAILS